MYVPLNMFMLNDPVVCFLNGSILYKYIMFKTIYKSYIWSEKLVVPSRISRGKFCYACHNIPLPVHTAYRLSY